MSNVHYHDYLQLDKILSAQDPESAKHQVSAHDEMLFIIIHQAYELWFKQLHHEADSVVDIMRKPSLNDNSPELQTVVHRLNRMVVILRVLIHQIDILETMTPMDFLDFRDMLRPASGFQSWQFKLLEAKLGLKFEYRHGKEYYTAQLRQEHVDLIKSAETSHSFLQLVNDWLERMPLFTDKEIWKDYPATSGLVHFLHDDKGVIDDYISYEHTGAHSPHHQVFWIREDDQVIFFGGDDAPQLQQMKVRYKTKYDHDPEKAMQLRQQWWKQGNEEGWTFLFYHDIKIPMKAAASY